MPFNVAGMRISGGGSNWTPGAGGVYELISGAGIKIGTLEVTGVSLLTGGVTVSSTLSLANGTAAAPSLRLTNSLTTGLYRVGADQLGLTIAGVLRVTFAAAGITSTIPLTINSAGGVTLVDDAAGVLAQKNGAVGQTLRVYGTTVGSKYVHLYHDGGNGLVGSNSGDFYFQAGATVSWVVKVAGHLQAVTDNAFDIGADGATRPRTAYLGTSLVSPLVLAGAGTALLPSLSFGGDPNTGVYNIGADQLGVSVGGVLSLTVTTSIVRTHVSLDVVQGGVSYLAVGGGVVRMSSAAVLMWASTNDALGGTGDIGFSRNTAGVAECNSSTTGQYRDLIVRRLISSSPSALHKATSETILYGATTDAATAVELTTDGAAGAGSANRISVPLGSALSVVMNIAVKQTGSASGKQMLRQFVITNNGGVVAIQGTVVTLGTDSGTAGLATVSCTVTANDGDDCIKIEVNGVAATNLKYSAFLVATEVKYA